MTLSVWIKRALCFAVGHRECDLFWRGTHCLRCGHSYNYATNQWEPR